MKQISNWVFGSFFRTIGRLLVFVLLGVLIANFVDFGNLKDNFSITNLLGIEMVKADSYQAYYLPTISSPTTQAGYIGKTYTIPAGGETGAKEINFETPTNITGYPVEIRIPIFIGYLVTGSIDNAVFYESNNSFAVSAKYTIKGQTTYSMTQYCILEQSAGENQNQVVARCPILNNYNIMGIRVSYQIRDYSNQQHNMFIGYNRNATIVYDNTQGISSTIQEQTQQQQQQHNETQSYLEDSNTTQAESEASDFFSDFEVDDHGGLSGIITAPLSTIQSLLNNTCTNLVLPLPFVNSNLTLPCMNSIYNEHFGAFFTIYQTIILAIISYRCLRSLFYDVRGFINPDDDRIEVMDL